MIKRTTDTRHASYKRYGARGIRVCQAWAENFGAFRAWALQSGYADSLSIDRVNNEGDYAPNNCRWATPKEQAANRRTRSKQGVPVKTFKQICAQGEIITDVVACLPKGANLRKVEPVNGKLIVSHSESGHHHYIPADDAELLERTDNVPPGMQVFFSVVKRPTRLTQDASAPHEEIALDTLIFRHRIAREYDPFADQVRRVAD